MTLQILKEAIVEAVATLDECDGSRVSTDAAIDSARETLAEAYGPEFDNDVESYLGVDSEEGDDEDDLDEV